VSAEILEQIKLIIQRLELALDKFPNEILLALKLMEGKDPDFPDLAYVQTEERERLMHDAAANASLETRELIILYKMAMQCEYGKVR
jgi:hypothetical protein